MKTLSIGLAIGAMLCWCAPAFAKSDPHGIRDEPSQPASQTSGVPTQGPAMLGVVGKNLTHTVAAGESLYTLGLHYELAIEHLMWANGLSGLSAPVGKKIVVPQMHIVPWDMAEGLVVNLPERGMYLFKNHEVVAFYPCAIGRGGRFATPCGDAKIVVRQVDPTWDPPSWSEIKKPVPPGPGNPLGDRWIGLSMDGVGMHGTNDPMSIGQNASHGCMRMYPQVIHKLFDQVKVGMPVKIMYDPIKLGMDPSSERVYVQVYQDVYGRIGDREAYLKDKIERAGLSDLVDDDRIKELLAHTDGLLQPLLPGDITVKINGKRENGTLAPFLKDGQLWVTSDVVRALGLELRIGDDKQLTVKQGDQTMTLEPRLWNGKSLVPLKPVLQNFKIFSKWVPEHKTLLIYHPHPEAEVTPTKI
jgi:L,D-transpeptidase ErfK/SrfK